MRDTQVCIDFGHCYCLPVCTAGGMHLECCMCGHRRLDVTALAEDADGGTDE